MLRCPCVRKETYRETSVGDSVLSHLGHMTSIESLESAKLLEMEFLWVVD